MTFLSKIRKLILTATFETITLCKLFYLFVFFVTGDKNTKSSSIVYLQSATEKSLHMSLFVVTHSELFKTSIFQTNHIFT